MEAVAKESRSCTRCDYETTEPFAKCPQCGKPMRTATTVRRLGWVLIVTGIFLIGLMGFLTIAITRLITQSNEPGATTRFEGGPDVILAIYGLFGFVMLFGLVGLAAGIWQVKYGKRNKKLAYVILAMGVIFIIIGWVARLMR